MATTRVGNARKLRQWAMFTAVVLLPGGFWVSIWWANLTDSALREAILTQARAIASTVHPERVKALSFTEADRDRPEFVRLRQQMMSYRDLIQAQGIWSLTLRDGDLLFGPETYPDGNPLASPPGAVYEQPSAQVRDLFHTGQAFVQGPYIDEYGAFVSAFAPVFDPRSNEILMAIGVDMDATDWQTRMARVRLVAVFYVLVLGAIVMGGAFALYRQKGRGEVYWVALCGLALTFGAAMVLDNSETRARRKIFSHLTEVQAHQVQDIFYDLWRHQLGSLARFYENSDEVTRGEFQAFVHPIVQQNSIQGLTWIPAVPATEKDARETQARSEVFEGFSIWQRTTDGQREPASGRDVYYPVWHTEPLADNQSVLGYDVGSEPVRRAALETAIKTGLTTGTDPITLLQETENRAGLLVFHPVFLGENRILQGFVLTALRLESLLVSTLSPSRAEDLPAIACLHQLQPDAPPIFLAASAQGDAHRDCGAKAPIALSDSGHLSAVYPLFIFGKTYALIVHPGPAFLSAHPARARW